MPSTSGGHAAEQYLPENLRRNRDFQGISQSALARQMSDRGWPWHQQTVHRVETGKQQVGFGEVTDLADILGVTADQLAWPGEEAAQVSAVDAATGALAQAWQQAAAAVEMLEARRAGAGRVLASSRTSKYGRVISACDELEAKLGDATLDTAVAEGLARYANPER